MMNPASSNIESGISAEQQQQLLLSWRCASQQQPPRNNNASLQLQQHQQSVSLPLLEQQQHELQANPLNQSLLLAAAVHQQRGGQYSPHVTSLSDAGNTTTSTSSSSPGLQLQQQYLLELELRRQILQQQQRLLQSQRTNVSLDSAKSVLSHQFEHLLSAELSNHDSRNIVAPSASNNISITNSRSGNFELDRLMAAETILQRNRIHDAVRMLQIQGAIQDNHHNDNNPVGTNGVTNNAMSAATSGLMIPNDPIKPHTFDQASSLTNSAPNNGQLLHTGMLHSGQVGPKVPRTPTIDNPNQGADGVTTKRKADSTSFIHDNEPTSTKKGKSTETIIKSVSSFPLPSTKQARTVSVIDLKSFQDVWDELDTTPQLQKEIFIRRLYRYDRKLID